MGVLCSHRPQAALKRLTRSLNPKRLYEFPVRSRVYPKKEEATARQERYSGVCTRSFYVGDVKPEDVKAKYESGVLTVVLPKEDARKLPSESKIAIE